MFNSLVVGEIGTERSDEIVDSISTVSVSLTLDLASQLSFTVIDPDLRMHNAGYFVIRRPITYESIGYQFETSAVDVNVDAGSVPSVRVDARSLAVQKLKRDKGAKNWGKVSPTEVAAQLALEMELGFFGEGTAAKEAIVRTQNENSDESSWDVLSRLASDLNFLVFEAGGILYFASETNLVSSQPHIVFTWPCPENDPFYLHSLTVRRSDDDVWGGELRATVSRTNGTQIRPGMSVELRGVEYFGSRYFLIDSVEWEEGSESPVSVSARMLEATPDVGCETKTFKLGDTGDCVKRIQQILKNAKLNITVAVSGTFDAATETAVKAFQTKYGLTASGIVDRPTWAAMMSAPAALARIDSNCAQTVLRRTNTGDCVKTLQELLNTNGFSVTVNGVFDADTEEAVEGFQTAEGLEATGVVDAATWAALGLLVPSTDSGDGIATGSDGSTTPLWYGYYVYAGNFYWNGSAWVKRPEPPDVWLVPE